MVLSVGIDLAGKDENPSGICKISGKIELYTLYKDQEILGKVKGAEIIVVDAPLADTDKPFRSAEKELMKNFGPMLPLNMDGMKQLSRRAKDLTKALDPPVVETYPRSVEENLDIDREELPIDFKNEHEYDAFLCALSAEGYIEEKYKSYGHDDEIVIPETELEIPL